MTELGDTSWNTCSLARIALRAGENWPGVWWTDPSESSLWPHGAGASLDPTAQGFPRALTPEVPDTQGDHVLFTHPRTWLRDLDPFARTNTPHVFYRAFSETDESLRARIAAEHRAVRSEDKCARYLWPGLEFSRVMPASLVQRAIVDWAMTRYRRFACDVDVLAPILPQFEQFPADQHDDQIDVARYGVTTFTPTLLSGLEGI